MTMTFEKTSTESDDFFGDRVEAKEMVLLIFVCSHREKSATDYRLWRCTDSERLLTASL